MASSKSLGKLASVFFKELKSTTSSFEKTHVLIFVDSNASDEVVQAIHKFFIPERLDAQVSVCKLKESNEFIESLYRRRKKEDVLPDVVLILPSTSSSYDDLLHTLNRKSIPCAIVVESAVEVRQVPELLSSTHCFEVITGTSEEALFDHLSSWIVGATDKFVSFAAAYSFCRAKVITQLVSSCAKENAAIGAVSLVPGSDMPLMTARQIRLALDISSAYNVSISFETIAELLGVVSAGLGYRTIARGAAGVIPGFGWVLKAGMGYAGTYTTAKIIEMYVKRMATSSAQTKTDTSSSEYMSSKTYQSSDKSMMAQKSLAHLSKSKNF